MIIEFKKPSIWRLNPIHQLTKPAKGSGGRNNLGRIVTYHKGGRVKTRFRIIDFRRRFVNIPAYVLRIERDPIRGTPLALIVYANGVLSYILAVKDMFIQNMIMSGENAPILPGCATNFKRIPMGQFVHNIENILGFGGTFIRTAGSKAQILRKKKQHIILKLPSGEIRAFNENAYATIGVVEQSSLFRHKKLKAGNNRWLGKRPVVRGVAQNPIDHPHGGGEGKSSGGRHSCSPWGVLTKGYVTRRSRKSLVHVIKTRRQAKLAS